MSLKKLARSLAKDNGGDVEKALELLKARQKDIECSDYFTAFTMSKIREYERLSKSKGNK